MRKKEREGERESTRLWRSSLNDLACKGTELFGFSCLFLSDYSTQLIEKTTKYKQLATVGKFETRLRTLWINVQREMTSQWAFLQLPTLPLHRHTFSFVACLAIYGLFFSFADLPLIMQSVGIAESRTWTAILWLVLEILSNLWTTNISKVTVSTILSSCATFSFWRTELWRRLTRFIR